MEKLMSSLGAVANARIMMVDDEQLNMDVLMAHLEEEGYGNFISESDSTKAFDAICEVKPDVLLLDLMMPDVSGFDILKLVRSHEPLQHLPVVVLTSSDDSNTKLKALQLGATDFLSKPVDASELALRLRNTLAARAYQYQMTHFDTLTGLPNREEFVVRLESLIQGKEAGEHDATLVLVNIDRFKHVNDLLGRKSGDKVLHAISIMLKECFDTDAGGYNNDSDTFQRVVFRLGGDQFGVLLPDASAQNEVVAIIGKLLRQLQQPLRVANENIYLSLSMGISRFPQDASSIEELYNRAETALLESRDHTQTTYCFYSDEMDARAREYVNIETSLRPALEKNEFFLTYQPKVCVQTGDIIGAEALLRWNHPEYGLISPDRFIPLAEDNGAIVPIGRWVLQEACLQAAEWRANLAPDFRIAVNVSILQLREPTFMFEVKQALDAAGIRRQALQIELTENMLMENAEDSIAKLDELKSLGIKISIDDFGTGYSSLSYLQKFSVDELKIDQSFIREIQSATDKAPIVKAVTSLGHDLGMKLVAEGVETNTQLTHIRALNVQEYQGFLCSKPLIAKEFGMLLEEQQRKAG